MKRIVSLSQPKAAARERRAEAMRRVVEISANEKGTYERRRHRARLALPIQDGCVFVVSDQHYHAPSGPSVAHRASVMLAKALRPYALITNGDALDAAAISRWPASSFTDMKARPMVADEIREVALRLADYEDLDFVKFRAWNLGNHDARFETWLAEKAPQYQGVPGFTLKDHFPDWMPAWRTDFVRDVADEKSIPELIVQHRYKGGQHAGHNNVLNSGTNYVTGHDHMLKAYTVTNVRGLFWGVHAGTMAPIDSVLFTHYTEDKPVNWQEGFPILHFKDGQFIGPELVHVTPDQRVLFRGEVLKV